MLVLGSAGRGESLLAADQDNAIVYASGVPGGPEDVWFKTLAVHIADCLDEVGVPYCKGGVMAKNAVWRHSVEGWRSVIDGWVRRQRPEDLLNVDIYFDGTVVHGDAALGEAILAHAFEVAGRAFDFQKQLAELARRWQPPFTWFGGVQTGPDGRIDLKLNGLMPIFTAARTLAIRHGIRARSTPERLRALVDLNIGSAQDIEALVEAHRSVMGVMLGQQLVDAEAGVPLSPRVALKRLDRAQKARLKTALQQVAIAVDLVGEGRM